MSEMETATFGAGCFWGVEAAFSRVKGVVSTSVGYMGGHFEHPGYLDVLSRITGHAEVVKLKRVGFGLQALFDTYLNIPGSVLIV